MGRTALLVLAVWMGGLATAWAECVSLELLSTVSGYHDATSNDARKARWASVLQALGMDYQTEPMSCADAWHYHDKGAAWAKKWAGVPEAICCVVDAAATPLNNPPQTPNSPPELKAPIPSSVHLRPGEDWVLNLDDHFSDADGDVLAYSWRLHDSDAVTVALSGSVLTVTGAATGAATVTVEAADALTAVVTTVSFQVFETAQQQQQPWTVTFTGHNVRTLSGGTKTLQMSFASEDVDITLGTATVMAIVHLTEDGWVSSYGAYSEAQYFRGSQTSLLADHQLDCSQGKGAIYLEPRRRPLNIRGVFNHGVSVPVGHRLHLLDACGYHPYWTRPAANPPTKRGIHRLVARKNGNKAEIRLHLTGEKSKPIPQGINITIYSQTNLGIGSVPGCALKVVRADPDLNGWHAARDGRSWRYYKHWQCRHSRQSMTTLWALDIEGITTPSIVEVKNVTHGVCARRIIGSSNPRLARCNESYHDGPREVVLKW